MRFERRSGNFLCVQFLKFAPLGTALLLVVSSWADELVFADSFYLGARPRNDDGRLREVFANTSLDDFWVQYPGNAQARWRAGDGHDFGWQFSASSIDPLEPPEESFGGNGTLTARGNPAALLAFTPPSTTFSVAANLLPLGDKDWVAIGFTSSAVLSNNFENSAQAWLRLWGNGDYEVRLNGTSGASRTGRVTKIGFTPTKLIYDPATRNLSGFVNDTEFEPLVAAAALDIRHVGLEARTADPLFFAHANHFRVTRLSQPPATPQFSISKVGNGVQLAWPASANFFVLQQSQSSTLSEFVLWKSSWNTNIIQDQITLTIPQTNAAFFRLRHL